MEVVRLAKWVLIWRLIRDWEELRGDYFVAVLDDVRGRNVSEEVNA